MPAGFINAILAVTSTPAAQNAAVDKSQRILAAIEIEKENKGESGRMVSTALAISDLSASSNSGTRSREWEHDEEDNCAIVTRQPGFHL